MVFVTRNVLFRTIFPGIVLLNTVVSSLETSGDIPLESIPVDNNDEQNDGDLVPAIRIPYLSSPIYLTQLAHAEQSIYRYLLEYEMQLQKRLEILQRLRTDYEESVLLAMKQLASPELFDEWLKATVVSSHPILTYRMIRRFATDFQEFRDHIWQSLENELWENLEKTKLKFAWPSQEDLVAATKSLIRLQDIHDFDLNLFTNGAIQDHYIKVGLTARQCLQVSETALEVGNINAAADWFQAAHFKGVNGIDNSLSLDELTQTWGKTYQAFQSIWPLQIFATHDIFKEAKELLRNDFDRRKGNLTREHSSLNFRALCRGDQLLPPAQISRFLCYLENQFYPYYYVNPLRIEMYSWQPLVYKVHNLVDGKAIRELSSTVVPAMVSLVESGVATWQAQTPGKTHTYTSIVDSATQLLSSLTTKIVQLPGLNVFQFQTIPSENYVVSTFAIGNHYEPCNGCFEAEFRSDSTNDRGRLVSTVHIVLHEPERGGELAFPMLGISITPSLGSAIIHSELSIYGNVDERTIHGSCPVLIGEKWVATKFIYEVLK